MEKYIIANWKMYKTFAEIQQFANVFESEYKKIDAKNIKCEIAVPSIYLLDAKKLFKNVEVISQDAHYAKEGAFTGNISWNQLKDCNIKGSLVGHSERRQFFNDTDDIIHLQIKALLENEMQAVLCIGETIDEYEKNHTFDVIHNQTLIALENIDKKYFHNLIIAYEPTWAIGTGKIPVAAQIDQLIAQLKQKLSEKYSKDIIAKIPFLYGGSVNDKNCTDFFKQKNIDGALVGGFCLKPENYVQLIKIMKGI
ncbi:MAG: triose-phosphate isomerase [Malacoplasma sp.]|nr:triose-phosphate isomerase [Malacoplasma sp.]